MPRLLGATLLLALLSPAAAQTWRPTFADENTFEVSASTYPWEVHDEGVEAMLDNMQQMAGVNSVYLIALMHHEPRPFKWDRFPHNPVRPRWFAEDSVVFWHPDVSRYKRIKPLRSKHAWLRDTDWLQVVIDAARQRGIKVGVEISHTPMPRDILNAPEYADLMQQDFNGKPANIWAGNPVPCLNHPDVEEYLLTLFTDVAKKYDLDYIQTCMVHFASGEHGGGGCFCGHCKRRAPEFGIDLNKIAGKLRQDPDDKTANDKLLSFRRQTVKAFYRKLVDATLAARPGIDFRLNHFTPNAYKGGLFIEDLAGILGSIRIMEYTEQHGDPTRMVRKEKWLADVHRKMAGKLPVLSALGVRAHATPELIHEGVRIAVDSGVSGVTLGHYDGSAFSILRAVRNGLVEAGVPGITPIQGVEAEDMRTNLYRANPYLLETCINTDDVGTATHKYTGKAGLYDLKVSYADEKDGQGSIAIAVNDRTIASWTLNRDLDCWTTRRIPNIRLKPGDELKITGKADASEWARVDFIEFIPDGHE